MLFDIRKNVFRYLREFSSDLEMITYQNLSQVALALPQETVRKVLETS